MAVRPDNRLLDGPMVPVSCHTCAARVDVRKSSWDQTTVQWQSDALTSCAERRSVGRDPGPNGTVFAGCEALRAAIREAAVRGEILVQQDDVQ